MPSTQPLMNHLWTWIQVGRLFVSRGFAAGCAESLWLSGKANLIPTGGYDSRAQRRSLNISFWEALTERQAFPHIGRQSRSRSRTVLATFSLVTCIRSMGGPFTSALASPNSFPKAAELTTPCFA